MRAARRPFMTLVMALTMAACEVAPSIAPAATEASPTAAVTPAPAASSAQPSVESPPQPASTAFDDVADRSKKGRLRLTSILRADGVPLADAQVSVSIRALGKTYQTITFKGVVPTPAKLVKLGFRFNQEGAGPVPIDMKIYRITYADGASSKNRLPNSDFSSGFYYWAVYGSGKATTPRSDRGDGRMLRLRATAQQDIALNSFDVDVHPGSTFRLKVTAELPPAGSVTGYAAAFFIWGKNQTEGYRSTLNLVAPAIPVTLLTTDAAGAISLDKALPAGRYAVAITYAGDAAHARASTEVQIAVP